MKFLESVEQYSRPGVAYMECVETGELFRLKDVAEAISLKIGAKDSSVRNALYAAVRSGGTAYGFHWKKVRK